MVVLDIICRMPYLQKVMIIDGCKSVDGTVELIQKEFGEWHRKEVKEIHAGDEELIIII